MDVKNNAIKLRSFLIKIRTFRFCRQSQAAHKPAAKPDHLTLLCGPRRPKKKDLYPTQSFWELSARPGFSSLHPPRSSPPAGPGRTYGCDRGRIAGIPSLFLSSLQCVELLCCGCHRQKKGHRHDDGARKLLSFATEVKRLPDLSCPRSRSTRRKLFALSSRRTCHHVPGERAQQQQLIQHSPQSDGGDVGGCPRYAGTEIADGVATGDIDFADSCRFTR